MNAKDNFLNRLSTFESIITPEDQSGSILSSHALTETLHNEKVRMLRNGLTIIGFTILEDFIKRRVGEALKEISSSGVNFNILPEKLKEAVTIKALKGILNRADALKSGSEDYLSFIQDETTFVASTKTNVVEFSEYSLGWEKSNLGQDDIKTFLGIFNVDKGWEAIQTLSSRINATLLTPNEIFKNFARARHKAAHNTDADSLLSNLESFINQSKTIAFCFDALVNKSVSYLKNENADFLSSVLKTKSSDLAIRYIVQGENNWKEFENNLNVEVHSHENYDTLLEEAKSRSEANNEILLIKSNSNQLINWHLFQ